MSRRPNRIGELLGGCVQELNRVPTRCPHVAASTIATVCGLHPAAGLLCIDCLERHVLRPGHDDGRCVGCGHPRLGGHGHVQFRLRYAATLLPADSSHLLWSGHVRLALGMMCRHCLRDLKQTGASLATPPPAPADGP